MNALKAKVVKILVNKGHNEQEAVSLVDKHIEDALRVRNNPTPARIADIIICISWFTLRIGHSAQQ